MSKVSFAGKTVAQVLDTEFSAEFVKLMQGAMALSGYKYGPISEAYPGRVDAIGSLMMRLEKYAKTGNTEFLVDVANFAMIEFMLPKHPKAHFAATASSDSPGRRSAIDGIVTHEDNTGKDLRGGYENKSAMAGMRALLGD